MKRTNLHAILAVVVGLCVSTGVFAQASRNDMPAADKYVISARAGAVNYLEGAVSIIRATGRSGILLKRDVVEVGDRVTTGSDGRAEILLNPGSYIRLGKNSSFEFGTTDLEDLQIRLDSGMAMFEVFAGDEFRVSIFTPKGKVSLIETGIYRVDVSTDGTALVSVTKGRAAVGEGTASLVKEGRTGTVGMDRVTIAKFDKDKRDDLAEWSKARSKELTKMNAALAGRTLTNSLLTGFRRGSWGLYDSFGLWIFDASFGGYCFLPFGNGWRSPYGYWYGNGIYPYYFPTHVPPIRQVGPTPTGVDTVKTRNPGNFGDSGPQAKSGSRSSGNTSGGGRQYEAPPYIKVDRGSDFSGFGAGAKGDFSSSGSNFPAERSMPSSSSTYSTPPSSPPASAPVPAAKGHN